MSHVWKEGERVVVSSNALPPHQNPYKDKPRDLLGYIHSIEFRYLGNPGNRYIVKLDNAIKYYDGFLEAIDLYTAQHLRKRY